MTKSIGMSRLQLKLWLGIGAALLIGLVVMQIDHYQATRQSVEDAVLIEARTIRTVLMAARHVQEKTFAETGLPVTDQTIGLLPVHALARFSQDIGQWYPSGHEVRIASRESRDPDNRPDAIESEAIAFFQQNPDQEEHLTPFTSPEGRRFYVYTQPIRAEAACLACHGDPGAWPAGIGARFKPATGYVEGDMRAILSIRLPVEEIERRADSLFRRSMRDHLLIFLMLFAVTGGLIQYFVIGRLRRIRNATAELARGHYAARVRVEGRDELADLATAFNRMADRIDQRDQQLREAQTYAHLGHWRLDAKTMTAEWSEEIHRLFGLPPETPAGIETLRRVLHPEDAQSVLEAIQASLATGLEYDSDYRILGPDGEIRWINCRARPRFDEQGAVTHLEGFLQDISARKATELRLAESEERLRVAMESMRDAFVIFDSRDDSITAWNPAAERMFGYSADEALGRNLHALIAPASYQGAADRGRRHFAATGEGSAVGKTIELEGRRKDDELFPVELSLSTMRLGDRRLGIGIARDISERKEAERRLRAREQTLGSIFRAAPIGIGLVVDRVIREVNETFCAMLGYARDELMGRSARILYPDQAEFERVGREKYQRIRESGTGSIETRMQCKNGERIEVLLSSSLLDKEDPSAGATFTALDITERNRSERALEGERAFLQHVIDGIDDPLLVIGADYRVMRMNRVARETIADTGLTESCLKCHRISHGRELPCSGEDHPCPLEQVLQTGLPCKLMHNHRARDGFARTFEVAASPLRDEANQILGIIEVSRDITDHLALLARIEEKDLSYAHLAQHDALTGLPNRLLFADRLSQAIHGAHRRRAKLGVLVIDLDGFKQINDSFNHSYGDKVLQAVAGRLRSLFREDDTIARMGGDEFAVILGQIRDDADAAVVARKILKLFGDSFEIQGHDLFLGACIGMSLYPDHGTTVDELVRNADAALHRAKEEGRNSYQFYARELTAKAFERVLLEANLHQAVVNDELVLHYQPQLDLASGAVCGMEALVRWRHPGMGLVSPAKFIPLAEESGMIIPIGEWVLREATRQMKSWQDAGFIQPSAQMSVNLSAKQFEQEDLIDMIESVLAKVGLDPTTLELEITESTMMQSPESTSRRLSRLRQLGVKVAIDDFGTGYSSLSYLKALPLTKLKIDQSFVSDIPNDINNVAIAKAIIGLAKSLSLDVLAEGVETPAQESFLIREGCRIGQGFLFSKPLGREAFEAFLGDHQARKESVSLQESVPG
ncbi:EAL domain-containing protein [Thiocystis violacea]|uniref:EAL domain-containing protein n=1 Tax=Thiocystis violacea TaxID=13725 RepID=UPI001904CC07|nr:EAL domain-containing protein [Thiocystis violacea]